MSRIRFALPSDITALARLGRDIHAEGRQSRLPYNEEKLSRQLKAVLEPPRDDYCILVAENDTEGIIGVFFGYVTEYYFSDSRVATNYVFYVKPAYRGGPEAVKLLTAFRKWAMNRGAKEMYINITSGIQIERFDKLMRHMGFEYTGGNYSIWLEGGNT